ncbi:MAG: tRNA dihydrouridine synthase DusB [Bacilli bacterium]|nr:tRNA dihydrouridine synthase DusB [Bacilli bacterium]MDD4733865.1 tRNA dihydrouridine synthase DusB [Bacilli bacterium]
MFTIGNVLIKNRVVLAPMAGICNNAFRTIIKEMGCGLIYAEMVSDKAISYESKKTLDMLYMTEEERPISQQIFGSDKDSFVKAAKYIEENMKPDIIDINMGCPVPKVAISSQAGSALLKSPEKVYDIVKSVVETVKIPVTVKIRSGWDGKSINAVEIAQICEKAGASAIAIHPRTKSQGYEGKSDWNIIKKVKENVNIPVIGNGDIRTCFDAKKMIDETGCDAVMIGRGVLGNPWIIKECIDYLEHDILPTKITIEEKIEMIKKHISKLETTKDEKRAILEIRSHVIWYLKGMPNVNKLKQEIFKSKKVEEILNLLNNYKEEKNGKV